MKVNHKIPHFEHLDNFKAKLKEQVNIRKDKHFETHMQARAAIIQQLGWNNTVEFDRWNKLQERKFHRIQNSTARLSAIPTEEPTNEEPVYIFNANIELVNTRDEGFCLEDLAFSIECDKKVGPNLDVVVTTYRPICNIWVKHIDDIEIRQAECSCRMNYPFQMQDRLERFRNSYFITNKQDLLDWAYKWGGIAYFAEHVLDELDDSHPLKINLLREYAVI